ncbi:LuxR C-terminal-related transcriptional regulator [Lelliottia sp. V89_10]|uniref:helix-turn-helix transcriptional regulator n=2 Tax=Lelliottia wanjuensis TaxID=3050585 RepID=UPI00249E0BF5|nr:MULTISPECIES: LuxR C-terminal-related transcriptional regulator [unclassified Lelliottia]MDI3359175.1 LuxR C-terminal-related transcriptional regulator [Lelliottia sp. V89_13]MDK9550884.1 LuxR C-terminal-related transcriptional regulator [Lelliottia sp. V89_5]MDK9598357.1 LuxR C-terminal-related transcriptional regulator [Lelliottia sp. V89_10]
MINILIRDDNAFYHWSMLTFLTELFSRQYSKKVQLSREFNSEAVSQADMIIMEMYQGEQFTCHPVLHSRTKGVIVGLTDKEPLTIVPSPECMEDIVFIERRAPLDVIHDIIINVWKGHEESRCSNCYACRHRALSPQQTRIMAGFYCGKSVPQIAHELNLSEKTIFSHKYYMMAKFSLSTDYELIRLLERLHERSLYPHLFIKGKGGLTR